MISTKSAMSIDAACKIMGKNYISPSEVIQKLQIDFDNDEIEMLKKVPYPEKVLEKNRDSHVLVPVLSLSINDIYDIEPSLFWFQDDEMIHDLGHNIVFSKTKGGWKLIRKGTTPDSLYKSLPEQIPLLKKGESVPSIQTMVYTIVAYFVLRNENLLSRHKYVRTSSISQRELIEDSTRVCIGGIGFEGMHIINFANDLSQYDLGLASQIDPSN